MKQKLLLFGVVLLAMCSITIAQVAYKVPAEGWTYIYNGDELQMYEGIDLITDPDKVFDGTWIERSKNWDFMEIGNPLSNPGGVALGEDPDGVEFLRIQDPGRPNHFEQWGDLNRKIGFLHELDQDGLDSSATIVDDGVTLAFRLKVPVAGDIDAPLEDPLWPAKDYWAVDTVPENPPYPAEGDGFDVREAFGMIGINQGDGVIVSAQFGFSLVTKFDFDTIQTLGEGLLLNLSAGPSPVKDPCIQKISNYPYAKINILPCNPREWNEFWIQIKKTDGVDTLGTHTIKIWLNGDVDNPYTFVATAGNTNYNKVPYMHMGSAQSTESMAMDVDYNAIAVGLIDPVAASSVGTFDMSFDGTQLKSYPNPSTGDVTFSFNLKRDGYTTLEVYNLVGQPVAKVLAKDLPAGAHRIQMNVDLLPGQYVYRLQSGDQNEISKMTILK